MQASFMLGKDSLQLLQWLKMGSIGKNGTSKDKGKGRVFVEVHTVHSN